MSILSTTIATGLLLYRLLVVGSPVRGFIYCPIGGSTVGVVEGVVDGDVEGLAEGPVEELLGPVEESEVVLLGGRVILPPLVGSLPPDPHENKHKLVVMITERTTKISKICFNPFFIFFSLFFIRHTKHKGFFFIFLKSGFNVFFTLICRHSIPYGEIKVKYKLKLFCAIKNDKTTV